MDWGKSFDRLQFDRNPRFNKQVDATDIPELKAIIFKGDGYLSSGAQAAPLKFFGEHHFIDVFQQPRTERHVQPESCIHDFSREFVPLSHLPLRLRGSA